MNTVGLTPVLNWGSRSSYTQPDNRLSSFFPNPDSNVYKELHAEGGVPGECYRGYTLKMLTLHRLLLAQRIRSG